MKSPSICTSTTSSVASHLLEAIAQSDLQTLKDYLKRARAMLADICPHSTVEFERAELLAEITDRLDLSRVGDSREAAVAVYGPLLENLAEAPCDSRAYRAQRYPDSAAPA